MGAPRPLFLRGKYKANQNLEKNGKLIEKKTFFNNFECVTKSIIQRATFSVDLDYFEGRVPVHNNIRCYLTIGALTCPEDLPSWCFPFSPKGGRPCTG